MCFHLLFQNEKDELKGFIPSRTLDEYITDMSKDGTYADHLAVTCVSKMLSITITSIQQPTDVTVGDYPTKIYIGYLPDIEHFVSLQSGVGNPGIHLSFPFYTLLEFCTI